VKIGSDGGGISARHVRPDKQVRPPALRLDQVLLLSVIAGMAHSTLKYGAATQDSVTFGGSTEDPAATDPEATWPKDHNPVIVISGNRCGHLRSRSIANGSMGRSRNNNGRACPTRQDQGLRTFSDSFLSGVGGHGKPQLPCRAS
jgi:hypothetical protein